MRTLLHVGCGWMTIANLPAAFNDGSWDEIRLDIDPEVDPDIIGQSQDMSLIDDEAVDAVYSSHNIEHVSSFEVPLVLAEFRRVIKPDGFLVIMCPDALQLAQAVLDGKLEQPLYVSPAGPITAVDILYGYQSALQRGNHYMAHKMAFTSQSLSEHLQRAGFVSIVVLRDRVYGLHAVATTQPIARQELEQTAHATCSQPQMVFDVLSYGDFDAD